MVAWFAWKACTSAGPARCSTDKTTAVAAAVLHITVHSSHGLALHTCLLLLQVAHSAVFAAEYYYDAGQAGWRKNQELRQQVCSPAPYYDDHACLLQMAGHLWLLVLLACWKSHPYVWPVQLPVVPVLFASGRALCVWTLDAAEALVTSKYLFALLCVI